jgi:hypothetical protein
MYKVILCPNCKTYQSTSAKITFKCIKCSKTKKLSSIRIYFQSENPNQVVEVLKEIKKEKFKLNNDNQDFDEFKSAL